MVMFNTILTPTTPTTPRLVIEVMRERGDFGEFIASIFSIPRGYFPYLFTFCMDIDLIMDRTGKLRDLALEWINKQKGKSDEK